MVTPSNSGKSLSRIRRGLLFVGLIAISGCGAIDGFATFLGVPAGIPGVIAQKAALIAGKIGGSGGFGGQSMSGYQAHAPMYMGFFGQSDLAAPEGLKRICEAHPDVEIFVVAVDRCLDKKRFIHPGLGGAGERCYNTEN